MSNPKAFDNSFEFGEKIMKDYGRATGAAIVALVMSLLCVSASAQITSAQVVQTLDTTGVNTLDRFLEMEVADPLRDLHDGSDFIDSGITGSLFRACKLTATNGLFCLDGEKIRNWPNPQLPMDSSVIIDCDDTNPALNLNTRKDGTCTGLSVDLAGTIWLAARDRGRTFTLVKVQPKPDGGVCSDLDVDSGDDYVEISQQEGGVYCADIVAGGRPLLVDISSVVGDVAEAFPLGKGTLGLEERKTAVFFPDSPVESPIALKSGSKDWGLKGNDALQSIALWQSPDGSDNRIVVTTDSGQVLSASIAGTRGAVVVGPVEQAFDIVAGRGNRGALDPVAQACAAGLAPVYGVRSSSKSGLVYVTDRQYCELLALSADTSASGFSLTNAQEPAFDASGSPICESSPGAPGSVYCPADTVQSTADLTLSTVDSTGSYPPEGPTVAPGIGINLADCAGAAGCTPVVGANGEPGLTLSQVVLADGSPSGMTLFQIKGIPDCRYIPDVCLDLLNAQLEPGEPPVTDLNAAGVVISLDVADPANPGAQRLNVTPLLPKEVTDLFAAKGGLPDLLISRQYRGQDGYFEAFFGITQDGVVFRDVFFGEINVAALAGQQLGCTPTHPPATDVNTILQWDVVTTVSERYVTVDGVRKAVTINSDCGSSKIADGRWSLKPYNLEVTPCTWAPAGGTWAGDGHCPAASGDTYPPAGGVEQVDDAVFAKLLLALFAEFGDVLEQAACNNVDVADPAALPPLSAADCAAATASYLNTEDKLLKCWDATQQPKQSSGSQNCQAFDSQLSGLEAELAGFMPYGPDPANRVGELRARLITIGHVTDDRFEPSIPDNGYCEPDNPAYTADQACGF